jgi:hypothetical protein
LIALQFQQLNKDGINGNVTLISVHVCNGYCHQPLFIAVMESKQLSDFQHQLEYKKHKLSWMPSALLRSIHLKHEHFLRFDVNY